MVRKKNT